MRVKTDSRPLLDSKSPLARWVYHAVGQQSDGIRVSFRLRGNQLHILCEALRCPSAAVVLTRLVQALGRTSVNDLLPVDHPPIYQVSLYGRAIGQKSPAWSEVVILSQLDRYLEQLTTLQAPQPTPPEGAASLEVSAPSSGARNTTVSQRSRLSSALVISNERRARQGQPEAIAAYLSETLSSLGVSVKVSVRAIPCEPHSQEAMGTLDQGIPTPSQRLSITCESIYSPDPILVAEPIARQLRHLELADFQDALVVSQVAGEPRPDWLLRIDLTPPETMLRSWARWGDVQAIARLLNQALAPEGTQVSATLNETTLHLFCALQDQPHGRSPVAPPQTLTVAAIAPILASLAPQGIHAATIYGVTQAPKQSQAAAPDLDTTPSWVHWLDLPAQEHSALADSTLTLAQSRDLPAIAFLLTRLLNTDLDWQLETGGIRIQILHKRDLLHIMADAPVCPQQKQVGPAIARFMRQLRLPKISGVRIYGRRAGQRRPLWSYGLDFVPRRRLVPEATPEFAASSAHVGDLIADPGELAIQEPTTEGDISSAVTEVTQQLWHTLQQGLIRSQLFLPADQTPRQAGYHGKELALIWGCIGVLLVVQSDFVLSRVISQPPEAAPSLSIPPAPAANPPEETAQPLEALMPTLSLNKDGEIDEDSNAFSADGFTRPGSTDITVDESLSGSTEDIVTLEAEPLKPSAATSVALAIARSDRPSFNSRQLDEKLALYQQFVLDYGTPDILVVGSSRALRGVDPSALKNSLAAQGYPSLTVFNFGVNGATAQVVDLIVRELLPPESLPRLIIWADGARAFNSGRLDITYNGIVASDAYKAFQAGTLPPLFEEQSDPGTQEDSEADTEPAPVTPAQPRTIFERYQTINQRLTETLGDRSGLYAQRDRLSQLLKGSLLASLTPEPPSDPIRDLESEPIEGVGSPVLQSRVDFEGFLPLSERFNPATYYQKYSKVSGSYDTDYDAFRLAGEQIEALQSLTQFLDQRQITLAFVNLPLTEDYLDPVRSEAETAFIQEMIRIDAESKLIFRDLGQLWPNRNDFFSDPSHLNRYGAYAVSQALANDPLIPWSKAQSLQDP